MPVPADSPFPPNLQVGQGATPNELDVDEPILSSQAKRFRDRDEYTRSMLVDGANAPEGVDVFSLAVQGVPVSGAAAETHHYKGFSAAWGSTHVGIPSAYDTITWQPAGNIVNVTLPIFGTRHAHITSQISFTPTSPVSFPFLELKLIIDGTVQSGSGQANHSGIGIQQMTHISLSWAGEWAEGNHTVVWQLLGAPALLDAIISGGHAIVGIPFNTADFDPTLSVFIV